MNTLDWIFTVILVLLGVRCMVRGFVTELLSVAALLGGLLAALLLYKSAGELLVGWGVAAKPAALPGVLGFAAVFALTFIVVKLIERLLKEGIEAAELGGIDRALGLLLGLAEGIVLVSLVLVAMSLLEPAFKSAPGYAKLLDGSAFARFLLPIVGPEVAKATQGIKLDAPELKLQLKAPAAKKP
jgi:membrane protein required for colicin V production